MRGIWRHFINHTGNLKVHGTAEMFKSVFCSLRTSTRLQSYTHHDRNVARMHRAAEREWIHWSADIPYSKYSHKNCNDTFLHTCKTCNTLLLSVLSELQIGCCNRQTLRNPKEERVQLSHAKIWVLVWSSKSIMISRGNNCSHNSNHAVLRQWLCDPEWWEDMRTEHVLWRNYPNFT